MSSDFDFRAIADRFSVKEELIEVLFASSPYPDILERIVSLPSSADFWDLVDSLPRALSLRLHFCQAKIDTTNKDFPAETLSPVLESFWAANLQSQGMTPSTINSRAITQIYPEHVRLFVKDIPTWREISENQFGVGDYVFPIECMISMCDAFVSNGRTWIFCSIPELRIASWVFGEQVRALPDSFRYLRDRVLSRLRMFAYNSSAQMQEDAREAGLIEVPPFEIPREVADALSALMKKSRGVFKLPTRTPEVGPINDWIRSRSDALVRQMALPLQQRAAFVLTPQVLQARMGQNPEAPFEPFSMAELLFSNSNGETAPMPFASCKVELPSSSPVAYCRAVFRRFAARMLLESGYEAASDTVLDILADVLQNEAKKIAQTAVVIQQGTQAEVSHCITRAIEVCGYDD
jgi:hypothetical protein